MPPTLSVLPTRPATPGFPSNLSLDDLRLFCRIARVGSLSAAARERNAPVSQMSRLLQRIEASYGVRLVHRSTHGLSLTSEGERFHESAERVVSELDELDAELHSKTQEVSGLVRVAVSAMMADHLLVPSLAGLIALHPSLRVDLRVDDKVVDMAQEGIDIAIRTGEPASDLWVMRRLGQLSRRLYASPDYLKQHGTPATAHDLQHHRLITHSAQAALNRWVLGSQTTPHSLPAQGHFLSNNSATQATMVLAGLGIARMLSLVGGPLVAQGRLVEVMPEWSAQGQLPVSAVMLAERHRLPKVRACIDYWVEWFVQLKDNQPL